MAIELMKKRWIWVTAVVLTPVIIFLLAAVLLYLPPVQRWAVGRAAEVASEQTGMDISVGDVRLAFPLDLSLGNVGVLRQNDSLPQVRDTIAQVERAVVSVQLLPLFKGQVNIDCLELNRVLLNTVDFVAAAHVKGSVGQLTLRSHGIDLSAQTLRVDEALLADALLRVELSDTVPEDSVSEPTLWKIAVDKLSLRNTDVTVRMPGDTLQVRAQIAKAEAKNGYFDLGTGLYRMQSLDWQGGSVAYDNRFEPRVKGLDTNHILLSDISLGVDSFSYKAPQLDFFLRNAAFREKSGIALSSGRGHIGMDSARVTLPGLSLTTPESSLKATVMLDLNAFDDHHPGTLRATIDASIGKQDIMRFMGGMPTEFVRRWPNQPLTVKGSMLGNLQHLSIAGLAMRLPTAVSATVKGYVDNAADTDHMKARLNLTAKTGNLGFVTALLDADTRRMVRIPQGIAMRGTVDVDGQRYAADITATEGGGRLTAKGSVDMRSQAYTAAVNATGLNLQHFVPNYGLSPFTGQITAKGHGWDFFSRQTTLTARADISRFRYSGYDLSGMKADAKIANGYANANIDSHNGLLDGLITLNALMQRQGVKGTLSCDLSKADLHALHLTEKPVTAGFCAHVDLDSDLKRSHRLLGFMSDITIRTDSTAYRPMDLSVDAQTTPDTTYAGLHCGDFSLRLNGQGGYERLMAQCQSVVEEMTRQIDGNYIDQMLLRRKLPTLCVQLNTGRNNVFLRAMKHLTNCDLALAHIDMDTSPSEGINGVINIDSLVADSMRLDTIRVRFVSDSTNINYTARVHNGKRNSIPFTALLDGGLTSKGAYANGKLYDAHDKLGVGIGLDAAMEDGGVRVRVVGDDPVLGYKRFKVNDDNYVYLGRDMRVSADLNLKADDGTGFQVYTNDSTEALQDITVGINKFELAQLTKVIPYMPSIEGRLNGDFHLIKTADEMSVSSAIDVAGMVYEDCPMGDVGSEFVYIPRGDGTHYVNGTLSHAGREVCTLEGSYMADAGTIDAQLSLSEMPLELANGFIPQQLFGLRGTGDGTLSVKGNVNAPQVDGEVMLDSAYLFSLPYGVELRFDDDPVRIVGSHLLLENFEMHSPNNSTLTAHGNLDFSDPARMSLDMMLRADNFQIIDARENARSEAYGKAFVNIRARLSGLVESLSMLGKIDVLGSTDMTYILRDSPISTDNQLEGLVRFTDFKDPGAETVVRPTPTGLSMDLTLNVDNAAHIVCLLNADQSNYIDLEGGGTLRMQYNSVDNIRMTGRYTLNNGEMKYSLPVIPLKTFTIQDGSYIEFRGDPMNPTLNITALEEVKASVSSGNDQGRIVNFQCGVEITKTLNDMGLAFIIDAPEDLTTHSELQTMSTEERGKIAVTMLTTGMYLADGNTSNFTMNNALSAFLQSQINTISGNALRTLDLSFGVDNTTDASGAMHTDYTFKFAKRFWNNRLRIVVGGKLSTGSDVQNQNESFFNNVTFEYRLSDTSNKYLKLFYNRDSYDWLEGDVGEFGGGFLWKRKLRHFKDIFRFRSDDEQTAPPAAPADTTRNGKAGQ